MGFHTLEWLAPPDGGGLSLGGPDLASFNQVVDPKRQQHGRDQPPDRPDRHEDPCDVDPEHDDAGLGIVRCGAGVVVVHGVP